MKKEESDNIIVKNENRIKRKYFDEIFKPASLLVMESIIPIEKKYTIASKNIKLKFYSQIMFDKMSKALAHNETDFEGEPDLTVILWDSVSTGIKFPTPLKNYKEYVYPTSIDKKTENEDDFLGTYFYWLENLLQLYDKRDNTAYFWIEDASKIPFWISGAPLRTIFNWFLSKSGIHLLHGAVVGLGDKAVLLTARGGSGKSTTALSCLFSGMDYLGDDYITVSSGDTIEAHSLFNSAKVRKTSLHLFPEIIEKIWNRDYKGVEDEKALVFLSEFFPEKIVKTKPLCAIMIPVIKNTDKTRLVKTNKLNALSAIIPTTLFQMSFMSLNEISKIKSIIERTPCYILELGQDIREVPEAIKSFLLYEEQSY